MSILQDPVWRRVLLVLFGYPVLWLGLLVGSVAFGLSVFSGGVLVDAAGSASLSEVIEAVPESASGARQPGVRAFLAGPVSGELDREVTEELEDLPGVGAARAIWRPIGYRDLDLHPDPVVSNPETGVEATGVLFTVTGGIEALVGVDGESGAGEGLWVPDVVADALGVAAGDEVVVELRQPDGGPQMDGVEGPGPTSVRVAGVYATVPGNAMPEDPTGLWESVAGELPPWPPFVSESTSQVPLLVADGNTYRRLVEGIGEESLATWDVELADPAGMTIGEAEILAREVGRLGDEGSDPNASLGRLIAGETGGTFRVVSGIGGLVDEAREARAATADGVAAMRVLAVGLSWTVVVLATVAVCRRRRGERLVLVEAGRSPVELGVLSAVESLFPVVVGVGVGVVASGPLAEAIVGAAGRPPGWVTVSAVGLVVGATVGVVSWLDAWRLSRTVSGRAEDETRRLPWRPVVVGAAIVAAIPVMLAGGDAGFDAVTTLFPLLALAATSIVVVAMATGGLDWLTARWSPKRLTARLVVSRSARDAALAGALLATAVSFGVVAFGVVSAESVTQAVDDKVAAQAGAASVVQIPTSSLLEDRPEALEASTVVWRNQSVGLGDFTQEPLLAVDPATFANAAIWSDRNADDFTFGETLGLLEGSDENAVRILVAGDSAGVADGGILDPSTPDAVPYTVTARLEAFPGMGDEETLLVVDAATLFEELGERAPTSPEIISEDDPDGPFTTEIWSSRPIDDLSRDLSMAGIPFDDPRSIDQYATQPILLARGWALDYLRVFTVVAGFLGVAVLVGLFLRDRDRRRIQSFALTDFGYPKSTMTVVGFLEVGVVGVAGSVMGALLAYWITGSVAVRLDPLPTQAPGLEAAGAQPALLAAVVFVAATLAAVGVAGAFERPRSINELLRDE